jgi:hypothetical protein
VKGKKVFAFFAVLCVFAVMAFEEVNMGVPPRSSGSRFRYSPFNRTSHFGLKHAAQSLTQVTDQ